MTATPFSRMQVAKLGERLVERTPPDAADVAELRVLLAAYADVLDQAAHRVEEELDVAPTARVKNTELFEKLADRVGRGIP